MHVCECVCVWEGVCVCVCVIRRACNVVEDGYRYCCGSFCLYLQPRENRRQQRSGPPELTHQCMQLTKTKDDCTINELGECLAYCLFLMCMSLPTTHELNVVACEHACKSGPFGCTPKPRRQADTVRTYTTQQLHDTDVHNTMRTTQTRSLTKIYYKDFYRVSKI